MQSKIKYIVHTSDIHIGKHDHSKYKYVEVFYNFLNAIDTPKDETLIVMCGDIYDNKRYTKPGDDKMFKQLLDILNEFNILIIPGNHDWDVGNVNSDDILSIKIEMLNYPNIKYVKQSCNFNYLGLDFVHINIHEKNYRNYKMENNILLFHGSGRHIDWDYFKQCHIGLLGDIHEYTEISDNVRYCGSLMQHNTGESHNKFILIWNIRTKECRKILIDNKYGFGMIDTTGMKITSIDDLPKININNLVRTTWKTDKTGLEYKQEKAFVEQLYSINIITKTNQLSKNVSMTELSILEDLLKEEGLIDNDDINDILDSYKKSIITRPYRKWHIKSIEFSNVFIYGPYNRIVFDNYNNTIIGNCCPNYTGKSSIIDIIAYAIYGKQLRDIYNVDMINIDSEKFNTRIVLLINGEEYYIDREGYRWDGNWKATLYYNKGNDKLEGIINVNNKVQELVGSFDDFKMTAIYYDESHDFVKMKGQSRRDRLASLIGIKFNPKLELSIKNKKDEAEKNCKKIKAYENIDASIQLELETNNLKKLVEELSAIDNESKELMEKYTGNIEFPDIIIGEINKLSEPVSKEKLEELENEKKLIKVDYLEKLDKNSQEYKNVIKSKREKLYTKLSIIELENEIESLRQKKSEIKIDDCKKADKSSIEYKNIIKFKRKELSSDILEIETQIEILRQKKGEIKIEKVDKTDKSSKEYKDIIKFKRDQIIKTRDVLEIEKILEDLESRKKIVDDRQLLYLEKLIKDRPDITFNNNCINCQHNKQKLPEYDLDKLNEEYKIEEEKVKILTEYNINLHKDISNILAEKCLFYQNRVIIKEIHELKKKYKNAIKYESNIENVQKFIELNEKLIRLLQEKDIYKEIQQFKKEYKNAIKYENNIVNIENLKVLEDDITKLSYEILNKKEIYSLKQKYNHMIKYEKNHTDIKRLEELTNIINNTKKIEELTQKLINNENNIKYKFRIEELRNKYAEVNNNIRKIKDILKDLEDKSKNHIFYLNNIDQAKKIAFKYEKYYNCLVGGKLIERVIYNNIKNIVLDVNNILEKIADFKIMYSMEDGKKDVNLFKIHKNIKLGENIAEYDSSCKPLSMALCSGYEKFAASLAFRLVFINMLASSPNFLFIDEGFTKADDINIQRVPELFDDIKMNYKYIFVISHLDAIKNRLFERKNLIHIDTLTYPGKSYIDNLIQYT